MSEETETAKPKKRKPRPKAEKKTKAGIKANAMQELFCQQYIVDRNATAAAIRAGYSRKNASSIGWQLLQKTTVKERVAVLAANVAAKVELTAQMVLDELRLLAFSDPGEAYGPDGKLLPMDAMPAHVRRTISGYEVKESRNKKGSSSTNVKLKYWDKGEMLIGLAKHFRLMTFNVNLAGAEGGAIPIEVKTSSSAPQIDLSKLTVEELRSLQVIMAKGQPVAETGQLEYPAASEASVTPPVEALDEAIVTRFPDTEGSDLE